MVCLWSCTTAQAQSTEEDYTTPVVEIAPLDMKRVDQIARLLPDQPRGFGEPIHNRAAWDALRKTGKFERVVKEAREYLGKPFPAFDETTYMRMFTHGDSQAGKDLLAERLRWLVKLTWAECLENDGTFLPKIEEVIKGLTEQKTWVNPRNYLEKNYQSLVELSCVSYAQNLAQALYMLDQKLSADTRAKIRTTIQKRMFDPILATINGQNKDHGWLRSTNNWNAVCLSGIAGTALTLLPGKEQRATYVAISERYHQNFMAGFLSDGYCTEGISYYNYGFGRFISLREIVYNATRGQLDFFDNPKMARIAAFGINSEIINQTYPAIADCKTGTKPSWNIVWYATRNAGVTSARYNADQTQPTTSDLVADIMYAFPNTASAKQASSIGPGETIPLRSYFDVAGILTVRPSGRLPHSMGAVFKGGRNNEHHNHNDVGSYTIAMGDEIVMGDPGSIPYTAKTFSEERYTYKSLGSYGHPVPLVAGKEQRVGKEAYARVISTQFSPDQDVMVMDLTSAYPVEALKSLKRTFSYTRTGNAQLTVTDECAFETPQAFEAPIITKSDWKQTGTGELLLTKGSEQMRVKIDTGGLPFTIAPEKIREENGEPYTRLAVRLDAPVKNTKISVSYSPVPNP
jgi:hypothetical protein